MNEAESIEAQANGVSSKGGIFQPAKKGRLEGFNLKEFLQDCKNDLVPAFSPATFGGLQFPNGTLSYIGARTGRGKTTALVSIAIEAIETARSVFLYSLEEDITAIVKRLMLCYAWNLKITGEAKGIDLASIDSPLTELNRHIVNETKEGEGETLNEAKGSIYAHLKHKLKVFRAMGATLETFIEHIEENAKEGDIVLLDYIQKMPAKAGGSNEPLERISTASGELLEAAIKTRCVIISAAQFNRESAKNIKKGRDNLSEADFRSCGDIEQDGHNLIGIGIQRKGVTNEADYHFYDVLKARRGKPHFDNRLSFEGAYSFMKKSSAGKKEKEVEKECVKPIGQSTGKKRRSYK